MQTSDFETTLGIVNVFYSLPEMTITYTQQSNLQRSDLPWIDCKERQLNSAWEIAYSQQWELHRYFPLHENWNYDTVRIHYFWAMTALAKENNLAKKS